MAHLAAFSSFECAFGNYRDKNELPQRARIVSNGYMYAGLFMRIITNTNHVHRQ